MLARGVRLSIGEWGAITAIVLAALPDETPAAREARPVGPRVADGLFVCGDWCTTASINGALVSGRMAAESVLAGGG